MSPTIFKREPRKRSTWNMLVFIHLKSLCQMSLSYISYNKLKHVVEVSQYIMALLLCLAYAFSGHSLYYNNKCWQWVDSAWHLLKKESFRWNATTYTQELMRILNISKIWVNDASKFYIMWKILMNQGSIVSISLKRVINIEHWVLVTVGWIMHKPLVAADSNVLP